MISIPGNEIVDPVTGEVTVSPGGGGSGVAPPAVAITTAKFGDPLPVVWGTAKIPLRLVFMRTAGTGPGWSYNGDEQRWDCVTSPIDGQATTGSSTTVVHVAGVLSVTNSMVGMWIYWRSGDNLGVIRTITAVDKGANTVTVAALTYAPTSGDNFSIGRPITFGLADVVMAACEAPVTSVIRYWKDSNPPQSLASLVSITDTTTEVVVGSTPGTWPSSGTAYGMEATGASLAQGMTLAGTVQLRARYLLLTDGKCPNISAEVKGIGAASTVDANPADVVIDLLSSATHGCGIASGDIVVNTGADGASASSYRTYCTAMGFNVSRALTERAKAADLLTELLDQTNSTAIWSGGYLKIIPLGDTAVTANGATYTPPSGPLAIGVNDLLGEVSISRKPESEVWNTYSVTYQSRADDYSPVAVEFIDSAHASTFGIRRASEVAGTWITTAAHAQALAAIKAQRSIGIRNTFRFRLSPRWALLDPIDLLSLTDPVLGLSSHTVRVKSVTEAEDGSLDVEAYEWPAGAGTPVVVATQAYDGYAASADITPRNGTTAAAEAKADAAAKADTSLENVQADAVTAGLVAPGAVTVDALSAPAADNLWPNPNAESAPPQGADTTSTGPAGGEFYGRTAAADAYAGQFVRRIDGGGAGNSVGVAIPVVAGSSFYLEAQARRVLGSGVSRLGFGWYPSTASGALDWANGIRWDGSSDATARPSYPAYDEEHVYSIGNQVEESGHLWTSLVNNNAANWPPSPGNWRDDGLIVGSWSKLTLAAVAPAGATWLYAYLNLGASNTADFDQLYLRRMVTGDIVVDGTLTASKIAARELKTSDYAYTGTPGSADEVATTGAIMRAGQSTSSGTIPAIITSPSGIKIGSRTIDQAWFMKNACVATITGISGTGSGALAYVNASGVTVSWSAATQRATFTLTDVLTSWVYGFFLYDNTSIATYANYRLVATSSSSSSMIVECHSQTTFGSFAVYNWGANANTATFNIAFFAVGNY